MDAQKPPIDVKVSFGKPEGHHNLLQLDFFIEQGEQKIKKFVQQSKITEEQAKMCVFFFDFYVEAGRQKDAINYFNEENSDLFSPLQKVTRFRPDADQDDMMKFHLEEHIGFVRLLYLLKIDPGSQDMQEINNSLFAMEANNFDPEAHVSFDIKGFISHNKKNRANVKVDYAKVELVSTTFSSEKALSTLCAIEAFSNDLAEVSSNPIFALIKKSRATKIQVKFDSFRKVNKFYNTLTNEEKEAETKGFNYTNKGIFRQKVNAAFVYNSKYLLKLEGKFESEDVFIRLIKVYSNFFEKVLDERFL